MLEEKIKTLQKQNRIRVTCNEKPTEIDKNLNVEIHYTCGHTEKQPFLKILEKPSDYDALLLGDTAFQKVVKCVGHCNRTASLLKIKPMKSEADLHQLDRLEHGITGKANIVIRIV